MTSKLGKPNHWFDLNWEYDSADAIGLPPAGALPGRSNESIRLPQFRENCRSDRISWWMNASAVLLFVAGLIWTSIAWNRAVRTADQRRATAIANAAERQSAASLQGPAQLRTIPIEQIQVGMRVPAHNPQLTDADRAAAAFDVDPKRRRTIRLEVAKESGGKLEVTLLRPVDWLVEQVVATELLLSAAETELIDERTWVSKLSAALRLDPLKVIADSTSAIFDNSPVQDIGSLASFSSLPLVIANELSARAGAAAIADVQITESLLELRNSLLSGGALGIVIYLDMPELGTQGFATIVAIEPCPKVTKGPGQIVTATFKHCAADVLDLTFSPSIPSASSSGLPSPASSLTLGVTASHPFWSVSRQDFIPAGSLELGEQVVGIDGQFFRLTSIVPRAGPENVYNFEVAIDHVYYVGEGGVLVHNQCGSYKVYAIVNKSGVVKYIGQTGRTFSVRRAAHEVRMTWARIKGHHVIELVKGLNKSEARGLEQRLIARFGGPTLARSAEWAANSTGLWNKQWSYAWQRLKNPRDAAARSYHKHFGNDKLFYQAMDAMKDFLGKWPSN